MGRIWSGHGVEGGHVHLVLALFRRQADVFFHHKIRRRREDVFGDDENACDDARSDMKQNDADENRNEHPQTAFLRSGVFTENRFKAGHGFTPPPATSPQR